MSDGSNFPFATRELIFHDGEKLELWGAGKIIDDYDGDFPSCDEHIERLAENSLANITQPRRMSDLSDRALQVIANPDLCTDRDGDQCFEGDDVSFFMLEVDPQDLTLLIEQDAMLIELLHSAYSYSTYGYDSGQRRLVELYGSGC